MMERVEAVVVGQHDVCVVVQKQRQHVVALLRYGVVQWRVAFRILQQQSELTLTPQLRADTAMVLTTSHK
jgi:hypothetical protein